MNQSQASAKAQKTVRIALVRHGNTEKAPVDKDRKLTEKGFAQSLDRRMQLSRQMQDQKFDMVMASSATRTMQTAATVAGVDIGSVVGLDILYLPKDPADYKAIDDMFNKLMYAPLGAYRVEDTTQALVRYGDIGAAAILNEIDNTGAKNILVAGHAVLLSSIASHLYGDDTDLILNANLGEVEGFLVTIEDSEVRVELIL